MLNRAFQILVLLSHSLAVGQSSESTGFKVLNGNSLNISAHSTSCDVLNSSGADQFVATKSSAEWLSFRNSPPTGLTTSNCVSAGGRQYFSASSVDTSTNSTTAYASKATLTFTPDANANYLIMAAAAFSSSSTSYQAFVRLFHSTASTQVSEQSYLPKVVGESFSFATGFIYTAPPVPTSQSFDLQFRSANALATASISDANIVAIRLVPEDVYNQPGTTLSTTNTASTLALSLSFTPASTGDYLLMAFGDTSTSVADKDLYLALVHGGTSYGDYISQSERRGLANEKRGYFHAIKKVALSGLQSFNVNFNRASGSSYSVSIDKPLLLALRLDAFPASYHADYRTNTVSSNSNVVWRASITTTTANKPHLVIATGQGKGEVHRMRFREDSLEKSSIDTHSGGISSWRSVSSIWFTTPTAASHTFSIGHSSPNSVTTSTNELSLTVLQLEP
jgi:hypothetical protein